MDRDISGVTPTTSCLASDYRFVVGRGFTNRNPLHASFPRTPFLARLLANEQTSVRRERESAIPSAALRPWRTGHLSMRHKLVGHAEQIAQHLRLDPRQANQHRGMANVVVCHVVNVGGRSEQFSAIIEI